MARVPQSRMKTCAALRIVKPNPKYAFVLATTLVEIPPRSPKFAMNVLEWKSAMEKKFQALTDNKTWELIPRKPDDNVINTKWVFKVVKYIDDGSVERFKSRLVANGLRLIEGSIRLVLTLAITHNWSIRQIDISNAFLHGKLEECIIVSQPFKFQDPTGLCV